MSSEAKAAPLSIKCDCGAIEVEFPADPFGDFYCHCKSCRMLNSSSACQLRPYPKDTAKVTKGADKLKKFDCTDKTMSRFFCGDCGMKVYHTNASGLNIINVAAVSICDEAGQAPMKPGAHLYYADRVADFADDLPKFKNFPESFGGDGIMLNNDGSVKE
jgi:hypothetical protein